LPAELQHADSIIAALGKSDRAIAAARGYVAAEQNFNPFVVTVPSICSDPTLPTTSELRGVVPLIDPAVAGQDVENANSATSVKTPFEAQGLSVADVMVAQGFSKFTSVALDGSKSDASAGGKPAVVAPVVTSAMASMSVPKATATAGSGGDQCGGTTLITITRVVSTLSILG